MMQLNNKSILLLTDDITIIDTMQEAFNNCNIIEYSGEKNFSEFDVIILDDYKLDKNILNDLLAIGNILNIKTSS